MKAIFTKLGFQKEDEMQTAITTKAIRISWFYIICMLGGTYTYEFATYGKVSFFPGFVLPSSMALFFFIQLWSTHRMTVDENGKSDINHYKVITLSILISVILLGIVLFFVVPELFLGE